MPVQDIAPAIFATFERTLPSGKCACGAKVRFFAATAEPAPGELDGAFAARLVHGRNREHAIEFVSAAGSNRDDAGELHDHFMALRFGDELPADHHCSVCTWTEAIHERHAAAS